MPYTFSTNLKQFPFLRLLAALIAGILFQWHLQLSLPVIVMLCCTAILALCSFVLLPFAKRFMFNRARAFFFLLLFAGTGMLLTWQQHISNDPNWFQKKYLPGAGLVATLQEPLTEKTNSWKTVAEISAVYTNGRYIATRGKVLVYLKKDSVRPALQYGDQLFFTIPVQPVKNSGNPGAFNYSRYCLFQNITGQVYLRQNDYTVLSSKQIHPLRRFLFATRDWALQQLRQHIQAPEQLGIAEALLIGYRNDLDKDLVQAYSNTGTVHIIAISGLHIGVIYAALVMFFGLFKQQTIKRIFQPVCIVCIIWLFTFIAGAAPSVLRAAIMFSFILAGKTLNRNGNIYNTLAASAFLLLIANPFYLWDVGFQLSYTAVLSIVVFFKPVNNLLYFKNRALRWVWQLCAVSISAQVFTLPLVVYHFHQLPVLFLFSNLLAVPLSGIILFAELLLFCFSAWPAAAAVLGGVTGFFIQLMNKFILHINELPFAVWDALHISFAQLLLLLIATGFFAGWIFNSSTRYLLAGLGSLLAFCTLRATAIIQHKQQEKLVVYNVSKHSAIDFIDGSTCRFAGDSIVLTDVLQRNFNIRPARIKDQVYSAANDMLPNIENYILLTGNSRILVLSKPVSVNQPDKKIPLGILILTGNTAHDPLAISNLFNCNIIVADATIPEWKAIKLKKEFEQLHLRFYSVAQQGAFTLKL